MNFLKKNIKVIVIITIISIILVFYYFNHIKNMKDIEITNESELTQDIEEGKDDKQKKKEYEEETKEKEVNSKEEKNQKIQNEKYRERIMVDVEGAVNMPGIVELNENERIVNVIERAGGLKENANLRDINLAEKVEDGMKIYIPTNDEILDKKEEVLKDKKDTKTKGQNKKVNLNRATQTELETIPGIGPSTAVKILNYRKEKGNFRKLEELKEISGIGESKFNKMKDFIEI